MNPSPTIRALALAAVGAAAQAQGVPFQTPGMPATPPQAGPEPSGPGQSGPGQSGPGQSSSGQSDRFTAAFNPAFSFIVDAVGDYVQFSDPALDDGIDLNLRVLEIGSQAWVDPNAWAYFIGATDGEEVAIEEAAIHYKGFGGSHTLRAGRFFVDFGKQMQTHVHELRTIERPLALRAYLGEEVKGDGLQFDSWTPIGDATTLRGSIGAFASLLPEESAFPNFDAAGAPIEPSVGGRKDAQDLHFTARVTAFTEAGEHGLLQAGASLRSLPDYQATDSSGLVATELSNHVFGADLTYGLTDETNQRKLTLGTEVLVNTGDTGVVFVDPDGTPNNGDEFLDGVDDTGVGYFAFVDYAWNPFQSAGLQVSQAELADGRRSTASEVEVYVTHMLSEFHRLRVALTGFEAESGSDSWRFAIQYTAIVGAHGHGASW